MATRVAVDAMGGDNAPFVVVEGAVRAVRHAPQSLEVVLFGPADQIHEELDAHSDAGVLPIQVVEAPEVIGMGEAPATAVKTKRQSSIHLGLTAHKGKEADAFVSAGNTGAVMAASLFILGRLPGVGRPSVIGYFPTTESVCIVLDIGTNVDSKPEHLVQFAQMGTVFVRCIFERSQPTVALLNIGEEANKGNELVKAAFPLLEQASGIHFRGNIEGRDIMHHAADVVVCDGFVGNVLLKFGESMTTAIMHMVGQEMNRQELPPEHKQAVRQVLGAVRKRFDYEEYGGAPLLGVNGNVLIGHGSSTVLAIERLILTAAEMAERNVVDSLAAALDA